MAGLMPMLRGGVAVGRRSLPCAVRASPATHEALGSRRGMSLKSSASADGALQDERVLEHLVCPISKFPLRYDRERACLVCDKINVAYPIRNGVPVLVPAEGRLLSAGGAGADASDH